MKTIIFDIDGTIFDTKDGIINCLNDVLMSYGKPQISTEEQDKYIGPAIKDSLIKFNDFDEALAIEATAQYREKYVQKYVKDSKPYPGLENLLHDLKNKEVKRCIATMKTRNQVDQLLKIFEMTEMFDTIETARYEGGYTKFDMLESIKSKYYGSDFVFVGDTNGDYEASIKAGILFVYASYGYGNIESVDGLIINSLDEIIRSV